MKYIAHISTLMFMLSALPLVAKAEDPAQSAWKRSYALEAAGKYQQAIDALAQASTSEQSKYLYHLRTAWLFYLSGRHAESVAAYAKANEAAPDSVEARIGGLLPLMALKRWQDAEQWAKDVLRIEPGNYLASRRLALILFNLGRFDAAEQQYQRVLDHYPSDLEMQAGVGFCRLRKGKHAAAKESFRAVLAVKPDDPAAQSGLASIKP